MKHYQTVIKKVTDLIPYINNSRIHDERQVNQIASSIKEFGFTNPILIGEDDSIVAGHGRLQACEFLKIKEVPCIVLDGLTDAQKKALVIADNKIALNSEWDYEMLQNEINHLKELDYDLDILGFDDPENVLGITDNDEPILDEQTYQEKLSVIIDCDSEAEQERLYNKLTKEGYKCQIQSL